MIFGVWSIFAFIIKRILGIKSIFLCSFGNKRMRLLTRVYGIHISAYDNSQSLDNFLYKCHVTKHVLICSVKMPVATTYRLWPCKYKATVCPDMSKFFIAVPWGQSAHFC